MARTLGQLVAERLTLMGCDGFALEDRDCACKVCDGTMEMLECTSCQPSSDCRAARFTECQHCELADECDSDWRESGFCMRPDAALPTAADVVADVMAERQTDRIISDEWCGCRALAGKWPPCDSPWHCYPVVTRISFCDECDYARRAGIDIDCDQERIDRGCCAEVVW